MMSFDRFKMHAENGPGALVSRSLTLVGTIIVMPIMIYLLVQVIDRAERTYETTVETRQEIRAMQRHIDQVDSRLDRQSIRILRLEQVERE